MRRSSICGLTLTAFTDLAVSYHHLFPLSPFNQRTILEEV